MARFRTGIDVLLLLLLAAGCSYEFDDTLPAYPDNCVVVHTSDQLSSAAISVISLETLECVRSLVPGTVHTDASLHYSFNQVYVVNRLGRDNLQILNPYDNYDTVDELSLRIFGSGSPNPHMIAFTGNGRAFVSLYDDSSMAVVDPLTLEITGSIDLSKYAYSDNIPCASALVYDERSGFLFAALQRLDRRSFTPADYSLIAAVDPLRLETVSEYRIEVDGVQYTNPYSALRIADAASWHRGGAYRKLLVSCTGAFALTGSGGEDGGLVSFSLTGDGELMDPFLEVPESTTYGDIVDFVYVGEMFYCVTLNADEESFFVVYDPKAGTYSELLHSTTPGSYLWRVEADLRGRIFVCDRNVFDPGVRVYDTVESRWSGSVIDTGLPPNDLLVVEQGPLP
ncbi:MAG: hypothetical protein ACOCWH_01465 [Spirochaetota bacterium]